jgi:hypothetical protein
MQRDVGTAASKVVQLVVQKADQTAENLAASKFLR